MALTECYFHWGTEGKNCASAGSAGDNECIVFLWQPFLAV